MQPMTIQQSPAMPRIVVVAPIITRFEVTVAGGAAEPSAL